MNKISSPSSFSRQRPSILRGIIGSAPSLADQADRMRDRGLFVEAAELYEKALAAEPCNAGLHVQCGHMNKEIGRWTLAEAHYRIAKILIPEDADLHLQLGHFYKVAARIPEAQSGYAQAAALRLDWAEPRTELANLPAAVIRDAKEDATAYLEMITHFRRLMLRKLASEGKRRSTWGQLRDTVLSSSPAAQAARLRRAADQLRDEKRYGDAAVVYEAALLGDAGRPRVHVQAGHMYKEIGRFDLAESHYLAARAAMPQDKDLQLQLGHFYKVAGRLADAATAYQEAANLDPEWQEPKDELIALRGRMAQPVLNDSDEEATPMPLFSSALVAGTFYSGDWTAVAAGSTRALNLRVSPGNRPEDLFDKAFYRRAYPEVPATEDAFVDYMRVGWREGRNPNPLFDSKFYLETYPDANAIGMNPLLHYILFGQFEGKNPHPLFDASYYLHVNGDVAASGFNPLYHFLSGGMIEGRNPHPLFNVLYYSQKYVLPRSHKYNLVEHYLTVGAALGFNPHPLFFTSWYAAQTATGENPLLHYVTVGYREGRRPNPLFDPAFYLDRCPDVRDANVDPLSHFVTSGWTERRDPHPLFDTAWYLAQNPSLEPAGINPLAHYIEQGFREDCAPSTQFDPIYYRSISAAADPSVNPLIHYVECGAAQGLDATPNAWMTALLNGQEPGQIVATPDALAWARRINDLLVPPGRAPEFTPPPAVVSLCAPLNLYAVSSSKSPPRLNVLLPGVGMASTSGGPNTVINLAYRLALMGVPIRIVSTDMPCDADPRPYLEHARKLAGAPANHPVDIVLADWSNRSRITEIGEDDQFLASAWWTAQMLKPVMRQMRSKRFFYMIQDYEPLLHKSSAWSTLAEETYAFDMIPVINTRLLFDFLVSNRIGRFGDPAFARTALVFDPAVDRQEFHLVPFDPERKRQLLFYARPNTGERNLFEIGVAVMRKLVADGVVSADEWDFIGMGDAFDPVDLGGGAVLIPAPWLGFSDYAQLMRESTLLLSLMLSPHPSYPPIEMAACGRMAVTTEWGNKTAAALGEISPNIIAAPPTVDALAAALAIAVSRLGADTHPETQISYPADWADSLSPIADQIFARMLEAIGSPTVIGLNGKPVAAVGFRLWPRDHSALLKFEQQRTRAARYPDPDGSLLSFVTTVWNTDPAYFQPLAESLLSQDCTGFEWVLLDNGSEREDTLALISELSRHPAVRVFRVEKNLGIIPGMRYALERATRRYIVPLDSDDVITPDCVRVITSALRKAGWPKIAYTDEDKIIGDAYLHPYDKPDWDPVLFFHSCYIAHLCCIDREAALTLNAYGDSETNGSHDWDTFTRFHIAGHLPLHIPEILYSWRLHPQSTAADVGSKSYITSSHRKVLGRLIAVQPDADRYSLVNSPFFAQNVDWRFIRAIPADFDLLEIVVGASGAAAADRDPHVIQLTAPIDWTMLAERAAAAGTQLVHLYGAGLVIDDSEWLTEAYTLMGLFPDVAVVGGRLHRDGRIVAADTFFAVADGCRSPNTGRLIADPGYFAQAWKPHSCDAVPAQHCVVRADLLAATAARLASTHASFQSLGLWLGRVANERGLRVVYSPFFSALLPPEVQALPSVDERRAQMVIQASQGGGRSWPPALGRTPATAFTPVAIDVAQREAAARDIVAVQARGSATAALLARRVVSGPVAKARTIAVLTSVWAKTDAKLFEATIQSVLGQTMPPAEWVILQNGPVPASVARILDRMADNPRVNLQVVPVNIGIMGAVRYCLERASCDVVVPMDADDLLVGDAFETLLQSFADPTVDLVFTDEDILQGDQIIAQIRRGPFDPILNANDSTIWHLCGFDRARAVALGVYTDDAAEFCHDWDTVSRFAAAGCRIEHLPAILYHWRHHQTSSSNSGDLNQGSLRSVQFVLQRTIDQQRRPDLYEIAPFPISRGVEQLAILRRHVEPLPITLVILSTGAFGDPAVAPFLPQDRLTDRAIVPDAFRPGGAGRLERLLRSIATEHVCILSEGCIAEADGAWEAMRLFELHGDVAIAGGRLYRADGVVVEACLTDAGGPPSPWVGKRVTDPGEAAMALKPQTARTVPNHYFYARTDALRETLAQLAPETPLSSLGEAAAAAVRAGGRRVAYSPLIQAQVVAHPGMTIDPGAPLYPGLPMVAGLTGVPPVHHGQPPGTILWPAEGESVAQVRPAIRVAADFMGRASVTMTTLADYLAGRTDDRAFIPLKIHKASHASLSFTGTPIPALEPGGYVVQGRDPQNRVVQSVGFIITVDRTWQLQVLEEAIAWRDPAIPAPTKREHAGWEPQFTITSTVYDTPLPFLKVLVENILTQTWSDFEWLVLDNGSRNPAVIQYLAGLAGRDERIRVFRVEENIHIIPGNRYLLERAAGHYIVPVDSDDIVYHDGLERFAAYAQHFDYPDLMYSDETKVDEAGTPKEYIGRLAPSKIYALSTCPAAHLMTFSRQRALLAGAYSDSYAKGSHDWDTYLRLLDAGAKPVQVPEILYGWRMHAASSALSSGAKDYLVRSQVDVLRHSLLRRGLDKFTVAHAGRHEISYYHLARSTADLPTVSLRIVIREDCFEPVARVAAIVAQAEYPRIGIEIFVPQTSPARQSLAAAHPGSVSVYEDATSLLEQLGEIGKEMAFTFIVDAELAPDNRDWLRDAVGTFELDPAVGIVGGLIRGEDGAILHCGYVTGLAGFMESPYLGVDADLAWNGIRRTVTATYGGFVGLRGETVEKIGFLRGLDGDDGLFGAEFCLRARDAGIETAFCPTFSARRKSRFATLGETNPVLRTEIRRMHADKLGVDPYFSRYYDRL